MLDLIAVLALAATHEVGDGHAYASIGDVPWEGLAAGDTVLIHWRPEPYREKWVVDRCRAPMGIAGHRRVACPGPGGALPVDRRRERDDAAGAQTTGTRRDRSIKIGGSSVPAERAAHAHRHREPGHPRCAVRRPRSSDDNGNVGSPTRRTPPRSTSSVARTSRFATASCAIQGTVSSSRRARPRRRCDVLIEGNWIHGNGNRRKRVPPQHVHGRASASSTSSTASARSRRAP